jgi:hypothetical protein
MRKFEVILNLKGSAASAPTCLPRLPVLWRAIFNLFADSKKVGSERQNTEVFCLKEKAQKNFKEQKINAPAGCTQIHEDPSNEGIKNPHGS